MGRLTIRERAEAYARSEMGRRFPESVPRVGREQGRDVLYAVWVIGNDYRNKSGFYGSYPPSYLTRLAALFPDKTKTLHVFSGALPPGPYTRLDLKTETDIRGCVYDAGELFRGETFDLAVADPPYSASDSAKYGTPPVDRRRATAALAGVVTAGGHLAWLDTCWPIHSKRQWLTVGRIYVQRSTNHRVRVLSIFERTEGV